MMTGWDKQLCRGAAAACVLGITASAGAVTPGAGGFSWSFQDTGLFGNESAIAMRNGHVFPVVTNEFGEVASLYSSGWVDLGPTQADFFGNPFRGSSSSDGRVAFVGLDNGASSVVSTLPFTGFASIPSLPSPFGGSEPAALAADFGPEGFLFTASEDTVFGISSTGSGPEPFSITDVAVSVNGDVGVVTDGGFFYEFNTFIGEWLETDLNNVGGNGDFFGDLSLTYDSLGRAHVLVESGNELLAADFNQQTGQFAFDKIADSTDTDFSDIAANEFGVVGTSYVENGTLFYAYQAGDGWASVAVTSGLGFTDQTGITFDYEGLPVLSYSDGNTIWVAYDPIVVPEPTAVALLSLAGLAVLRRRAA